MKQIATLCIVMICLLTGCQKKQQVFTEQQFISAVKFSINDQNLKWRMGILQANRVKKWNLNGTFKITDTLHIADRIYRFSNNNLVVKGDSLVKSDSTILYRVTYPAKDFAHINLRYLPSASFMITGDFDFKKIDGDWQFVKRINAIVDGRF
jgi:hypothetical protein